MQTKTKTGKLPKLRGGYSLLKLVLMELYLNWKSTTDRWVHFHNVFTWKVGKSGAKYELSREY
jgi:hypothetical protein